MKKLILFLTLLLFYSFVDAQYVEEQIELKCSHHSHDHGLSFDRFERPEWYDHYDVHFHFLDISVENNSTYVGGNVKSHATVMVESLTEFKLELISVMTVDSVLVNGISEAFSHEDDEITVSLSTALAMGDALVFQVYYSGEPSSGGFFSGISTAYNSTYQKHVTWTLSEPFNARDWWPVKQDLYDKADSVYVFVTTSEENMVGSNGLLTAQSAMPDGKIRYEWKSNYPIDYYLISISVAEYQEYNIYAKPEALNGDSILVQNFIYDSPGCLENYKNGIDNTTQFIEVLSEKYGMYPFKDEKYGHCLASIGGGMEHQTMTTIGGFGFSLVAHELGHMWFGDNVTCATWSDIWVNEGFASYTEYITAQIIQGQSSADSWMNSAHSYIKQQPGGSVYVPEEEANANNVWRIFDGRLTYKKGAAIIHMIRFELQDDEMFFDILTQYQQQYGDSVATGLDFMGVVNEVSGLDFGYFFDQWYFGEGYPIFDVVWNQSPEMLYLTTTQTTSKPEVTPFFETYVEYRIHFDDGSEETHLLRQTENINNYEIPVDKEIVTIQLDNSNWLIKDVDGIMVGISDVDNPAYFTMAPNPVDSYVNLFFEDPSSLEKNVRLTDLSGRMYLQKTVSGNQTRMDVSSLAPGVYLVQVTDGENKIVQRMIKK